jgi:NADH-quinone oxidoreductase subunit C
MGGTRDALREEIARFLASPDGCGGELSLAASPESLSGAVEEIKASAFDYLSYITAIDRGGSFEVVYRFCRLASPLTVIVLRVDVSRAAPVIRSIVSLYTGADWLEREVYDLFGIEFEGHPNLRRILLPDDWVGHPLRKDYADDRMEAHPNSFPAVMDN